MIKKAAKGLILGVLVTMAGLMFQCSSDPAVTGDGGLVDQLLADMGFKDKDVDTDQAVADQTLTADKSLLTDLLKDGVGPTADAAPDAAVSAPVKRVTFTFIPSASSHTLCGLPGSPVDPPAVTLWQKTSAGDAVAKNPTIYWDGPGCFKIKNMISGYTYRLVTIY